MALFDIVAHMEDVYGRKTNRTYQVDALDFAAAATAQSAFLVDLAALTKLRIVASTLRQKTGYSDSVTAGANKDAGLTLSFRTSDGNLAGLNVPDPIAGVVPVGNEVADLSNTELVAFADNFISGGFRVSDGETATELVAGRLDR